MALARVGTSTNASSTTAQTSGTVALPSGLTNGDIMIAVVNIQGTGLTIATPSGWTLHVDNLGPGNLRTCVLYRRYVAGDTGLTVAFNGGTSAWGMTCCAYTGQDVVTPLSTATITNDTVSDTTLNLTAFSSIKTDSMIIAIGATGSNSTLFSTLPSGYTTNTQAAGKRVILADKAAPVATAEPASTFTLSASAVGTTIRMELMSPSGPTADAGSDQINIEPFSTVTLHGVTSAGTYQWTQVSGPAVTLSSTSVASPTFEAPGSLNAITLVFQLTDAAALAPADQVSITMYPGTEFYLSTGNAWIPYRTTNL